MKMIAHRTSRAVISVSGFLRMATDCAIFSLFTVPAAALFSFAVLSFMTGSPSMQLLDGATSLIAEAPPGKVMVCDPVAPRQSPEVPNPIVLADPCEMQPLDINDWAEESDRSLKKTWLVLAAMGALIWLTRPMVIKKMGKDSKAVYGVATMKPKDD